MKSRTPKAVKPESITDLFKQQQQQAEGTRAVLWIPENDLLGVTARAAQLLNIPTSKWFRLSRYDRKVDRQMVIVKSPTAPKGNGWIDIRKTQKPGDKCPCGRGCEKFWA